MKGILKNNAIYFAYVLFAIIVEVSTIFSLTGNFWIKSPWISLFFLVIIFAIFNLIKKVRIKKTILISFASIQLIINLFCVILYDNTGTVFDFSMLNLVFEATQFVTTISINYWYIFIQVIFFLTFLFSLSFLSKLIDTNYKLNYPKPFYISLIVISLISQTSIIYYYNHISEKSFINSLYKDNDEKYYNLGTSGNFVNEISKMFFFNNYNQLSTTDINEYIYNQINTPTSIYGISKGNNLVTILAESLEWYAFINNSKAYPNSINISNDKLDLLFPNLRNFYKNSIVMNNHHSQNKTELSENEALLGSYPSSDYISYGFSNNTMISSLANTLKIYDPTIRNSFFHNNTGTFYNRANVASSLGYDSLYFIEEMQHYGVTNYMNTSIFNNNGLMNLDSDMINGMKNVMFPTDKRFHTHITTLSTHGSYDYRYTMQKWLDKLVTLDINIDNEYLRNYIAAVMEFDYALGLIIEDLSQKNLLDTTTIVLFSDHNSYMDELTYFVKNIENRNYKVDNYLELYHLPLMIYDNNIEHQTINKFTTTYDILPTILDIFGINYYSNLYYGNSIFSDEVSVLYSKAFNIFISDGLYFSNINNILFRREDVSDEKIEMVEATCLQLLQKIYYTNHVFDNNFFKKDINYNKYIHQLKLINN